MSLINDAIKRVAKAQPSPAPPDSLPQMQAVEAKRGIPWIIFLVSIALIFAIGLGVAFLIRGFQAGLPLLTKDAARQPIPVAAQEPAPRTRPDPSQQTLPPEPATSAQDNIGRATATPAPSDWAEATNSASLSQERNEGISMPGPDPAQPPVPSFPTLKLQGIYYRPANPSVVINSKTLYKGDRLMGAEVVEITKDSVTVTWQDETKVLTLQ